jgi:molecular chaperone GrpE
VAGEATEATLAPSPELEEALREAAAAVDERQKAAEAEAGGPGEAGEAGEPGELAQQLEQTQDRLLRLQADFENFRRRALKERTEANQYGHENLVKDLLSTVDNLDRAIDHARKSGDGDLESLLQGVELVQRDLLAALAKHGVRPVEALGKVFDPAYHEAMAQAPDDAVDPNTVIEELQKGYMLRDRLMRAARVVVARAPESEEDAAEARESEGDAG